MGLNSLLWGCSNQSNVCNTMRTAILLQERQIGQCQKPSSLQMGLLSTQHEFPWLRLRHRAQKQHLSVPQLSKHPCMDEAQTPTLHPHNPAFFIQLPQSRDPCPFLLILRSTGGAAGGNTHLSVHHSVLPLSHFAQGSDILILEPHLFPGFTGKETKEHLVRDNKTSTSSNRNF